MTQGRLRTLRRGWPFAALCLLAGSRWLLEGAFPRVQSTDLTQAAGCLLAAGFAGLWKVRAGSSSVASTQVRTLWTLACAGGLTVAGAALGASVSRGYVDANNATLALSLTPVVVAVAGTALGGADHGEFTARLWPGLAGVAGLLLLLPAPSFSDWRFAAALVCMPVLAGLGAALVSGELTGTGVEGASRSRGAPWMSLALVVAALVYGALWVHARAPGTRPTFSLTGAGLDGLIGLLSLVTLRRVGAIRWAAQFLLVPLISLLEGAVILQPALDLRSWLAFAFLAISSGYLLVFGGAAQREAPHSAALHL